MKFTRQLTEWRTVTKNENANLPTTLKRIIQEIREDTENAKNLLVIPDHKLATHKLLPGAQKNVDDWMPILLVQHGEDWDTVYYVNIKQSDLIFLRADDDRTKKDTSVIRMRIIEQKWRFLCI